jgi:hypothetical protein
MSTSTAPGSEHDFIPHSTHGSEVQVTKQTQNEEVDSAANAEAQDQIDRRNSCVEMPVFDEELLIVHSVVLMPGRDSQPLIEHIQQTRRREPANHSSDARLRDGTGRETGIEDR